LKRSGASAVPSLEVLGEIGRDCSVIAGRCSTGNVAIGSDKPHPVLMKGRTKLGIEHCRELVGQSGRRRRGLDKERSGVMCPNPAASVRPCWRRCAGQARVPASNGPRKFCVELIGTYRSSPRANHGCLKRGGFAVNERRLSVTMVTSVQRDCCYRANRRPKETHRGKDHSDQPVRLRTVLCHGRSTLSIPMV
jgi:hypothetical protein